MSSRESSVEGREPDAGAAREPRSVFWPLMVLMLAAGAALLLMQRQRPGALSPWVGRPLPPLEVGGWLNTDRPLSADDLRGQVVLVDFWSVGCMPCLRHMPELVEYHERFADRGVTMVGLTHDRPEMAEQVKQVVDRAGARWPIGYGAGFTFELMGVRGTPTYILYDRTGRSVWGGHRLEGLEEATIAALARQ